MHRFLAAIGLLPVMFLGAGAAAEDEPFRIAGAKIEPVYEAGAPIGLRFSHIVPGSCIARLDIRDSDVLVGLNEQPINSINDHVRFLEALKEALPFTFQLRNSNGEMRTHRGVGCGLAPSGEET